MSSELVLSLFPGIDLLGRSFEAEGFCVVAGPDVVWGRDIRTFHPPPGAWGGIIGGPPCQTFSALANLVRAKGYEPTFGNLIPEFERIVSEAAPAWYLMENVPAAPQAGVPGYERHSFLLDNCTIGGADGLGQEQERVRRFTFGVRGAVTAPDLRQWIQLAALRLPGRSGAVTREPVNNDPARKGRVRIRSVFGSGATDCPVAIGGSGKRKPGARQPAVTGSDGGPFRGRMPTVTAAHAGAKRPKGGHLTRYRLPEALRLQGFPEDLLEHAPFTAQGSLKLIANGVPAAMGRALARAIRCALGLPLVAHDPEPPTQKERA